MDLEELLQKVEAGSWQQRIAAIRSVPSEFPGKQLPMVYAAVARSAYTDPLSPHFHIVPWPDSYADREGFKEAYEAASLHTEGFSNTTGQTVADAIRADPRSLRIFRLILGYTTGELADTLAAFADPALSKSGIEKLEAGGAPTKRAASAIEPAAEVICAIVAGTSGFPVSDEHRAKGFRGKLDKPDTIEGWDTVSRFAANGVPYYELLYQRFFGGAFRQLQDAGGTFKGDLLEDAAERLFIEHEIPFVRTHPGTQSTAGEAFGVRINQAPDFIFHDGSRVRGMLECKSAGDGGTARDKASRFANLRREAERLGGVPVLALLEGLGWRRVNDALGPVVRDCDGRVFTLSNLSEMLEVDPLVDLQRLG